MSNEINLQEFKMHEKDSGSSSFQIALLTKRIAHLTAHLGENKHDVSSRPRAAENGGSAPGKLP